MNISERAENGQGNASAASPPALPGMPPLVPPSGVKPPSRVFAVIPAAGRSRRMGQPKLLLPLGDRTVMSRVLEVLRPPAIARTCVVVRPDDLPLQAEISRAGAVPVVPERPPAEMRQSVEIALRKLVEDFPPGENDAWLLMPADHPLLDSSVLEALLDRWRQKCSRILIPVCQGRRGHPVIFHWSLVPDVFALPPDVGLNQLVRRHADEVTELEISNPAILTYLDTPEDYARLQAQFREVAESPNRSKGRAP